MKRKLNCPNCGASISSKFSVCPECGENLRERLKGGDSINPLTEERTFDETARMAIPNEENGTE
ncbi:MAG: hypothetical protein BAJALOKI2v1_150019 [Promethearchaeota archaeon]|nr:MAG: hypothetical protein BAJALOKI2v1_150019 [Candidatus Lokiarchaeota archaeon]